MSTIPKPPAFFNTIAIGLPGGGFRAASFSLGILSFLNKCNLIDNVKTISTVSGGTITGAKFAQMSSLNEPNFKNFYDEMYNFLQEDALMKNAMCNLTNDKIFGYKNQNLTIFYIVFIPSFPIIDYIL